MVKYNLMGEISQLSIDLLSKLGPKMVELFPPSEAYSSKEGNIRVEEKNLSPKTLGIEFFYDSWYDMPCMVRVNLETKEVIEYNPTHTNGFATIKPHLEKILSKL
ncbi:hypothetical protein GOV13_01655 [Candidatus Pacearchaeota archaeon]|nr:hypothetical protein [Candidatus Pacearchaeota archaeon]